jgi:hypothetical protein
VALDLPKAIDSKVISSITHSGCQLVHPINNPVLQLWSVPSPETPIFAE